MTNRNIYNWIVLSLLLIFSACQANIPEGCIELEKDEVIMSDSGAPVEVCFRSATGWRIEYDLENGWLVLFGIAGFTLLFAVAAHNLMKRRGY